VNDFTPDDDWQRHMRDTVLVPGFYASRRFVCLDGDGLASDLQKKYHVDTIVEGKDGTAQFIEEKIVRWPVDKGRSHTAFALETDSCTIPGSESEGWMRTSRADFLLYCFETEDHGLDCCLIPFPRLQAWFWPRSEGFYAHTMPTNNKTRCRLAPIDEVVREVGFTRFQI